MRFYGAFGRLFDSSHCSVGWSVGPYVCNSITNCLLAFPPNHDFAFIADELEVEALFEQELGKMYNEGNPEDDMVEKVSKLFIVVQNKYLWNS